ncbi:solute carrier family 35 member F6-like [Argonauta hians]
MAWTKFEHYVVGLMLISGTLTSVLLNLTESLIARGTVDNYSGEKHIFWHPFFMVTCMFIGESCCLFLYYLVKWARYTEAPIERDSGKFNPLIFFPAALLDLIQMVLFFLGISLVFFIQITPFQIMKGVMLIFVSLLSVAFFGLSLSKQKWLGILFIVIGLIIMGLPNLYNRIEDGDKIQKYSVIAGELFIAMSQMLAAILLVYEQYWIQRCNILPLAVIGWEGLYGTIMAIGMLIGFYNFRANNFSNLPSHRLEDALDALQQIGSSWRISLSVLGTMVCFTTFRFAGVTLTKHWNATTRMVFECLCAVFIWIAMVPAHWRYELWYTPFGLVFIILGLSSYYGLIAFRRFCCCNITPCTRRGNDELLIPVDQDGNGIQEIA